MFHACIVTFVPIFRSYPGNDVPHGSDPRCLASASMARCAKHGLILIRGIDNAVTLVGFPLTHFRFRDHIIAPR